MTTRSACRSSSDHGGRVQPRGPRPTAATAAKRGSRSTGGTACEGSWLLAHRALERSSERRPPLRIRAASYETVSEPCPAATKERRGLSMERSDCWRRARAGAARQYRAVGGGFLCPEEGPR